MACFKLSKKNFLKLTLSLLTAFIILLGGIDHADARTLSSFDGGDNAYFLTSSSTVSFKFYSPQPYTYLGLFDTTVGGLVDGCYISSCSDYILTTNINNFSGGVENHSLELRAFTFTPPNYTPESYDYYIPFIYSELSIDYIYGCMDNMAINYDPTATAESGGCYYILPNETATSTRIISFTFSTTTNTIDLSYYVATSTPVSLYVENRNERDGVINSGFSTTTTGLTALNNIPVTLPDPLNGAGYTYLTTKLVLTSDYGVIYDWSTLTVDLYNNINLGGGGYQQQECGITNLGGCFMNGLAVMFYPSQSAFNNFNSFVELIKTKPPVGYFYVVENNLDDLNATSTPAFTVTIPSHIKEYLFTPFDVGIGGILWFFFAMNFYKRLKHITV